MAAPPTDTTTPPFPKQQTGSAAAVFAPPAAALGQRRSGISRRRLSEIGLGYTLLAPALILLVVFELFPILFGAYISACDWRLQCTRFIGFDNYLTAFGDPAMWHA